MIAEFVLFVKRVAGEFFPVSKDVVSAGAFCLDAQYAHGADDNIQLAPYVVVFFLYQEGEVDIPQIVIDGSAAGKVCAPDVRRFLPAASGDILSMGSDCGR